ncbi:hypothetical protein [Streptosporangium sp. NPDC087985]|uniref:hypothetical protein n=1 Tax=Streptosporangium sp. NPDC087985 TaxID=3366196 RepID=UPI003800AED5
MSIGIPFITLILLALGVALVSALVSVTRTVRMPSDDLLALRTTARRTLLARITGLAVGIGAACLTAGTGGLGRGPMLAAPALGLCLILGTLTGELAAKPPGGPIRGAALETRKIRHYLPRFSASLAAALSMITIGLLAVTVSTASADDMGRPGRSLVAHNPDGTVSQSTGPWPGWFYAWPILAALVGALLLSALVMHRIVRRGRPGLDPAARAVDEAQRAHSARVVTAAYGLCVALPLGGIALTAAAAVNNSAYLPGWTVIAAPILGGVALLSAGSAIWYLAELLSAPKVKPRVRAS